MIHTLVIGAVTIISYETGKHLVRKLLERRNRVVTIKWTPHTENPTNPPLTPKNHPGPYAPRNNR